MASTGQKPRPQIPQPARDGGPAEAAEFIAGALPQLVHLAHRHGLHTLRHLLEMARMEAEEIIRHGRPHP